jgi:hypothetical protein
MEFTITCPNDGLISVSLEDVDTVLIREPERAEIVFTCPHCGESITVQVVVPSFLMAAIEAMAEETDGHPPIQSLFDLVSEDSSDAEPLVENPVVDAYCEYFRRQLARIECADDALAEIDTGRESGSRG